MYHVRGAQRAGKECCICGHHIYSKICKAAIGEAATITYVWKYWQELDLADLFFSKIGGF